MEDTKDNLDLATNCGKLPEYQAKTNQSHPTKQTVQTGSGDKPLVCENELSGSQRGVKTGDTIQLEDSEVEE